MEWRGIFHLVLASLSVAKSSSRTGDTWLLNLDSGLAATYNWPICSAGVFVSVALILSICLIFQHLCAYNQPEEQKFLIGVILMVPVYALESFLSLLDSDIAFNCEVVRDCYEAFAMYCFERYLIGCLGGEENTIKYMDAQKSSVDSKEPLLEDEEEGEPARVVPHPFPLNCLLNEWYLGSEFYQAVKIGIVQYMMLKMICALLAMVLQYFGVYGEGKFDWKYGYVYLAVVLNFSQTWALYCLVQFYGITKERLEPIRPLPKFLMFKSTVFLTWWQGVAVAFLFSAGAFEGSPVQELKTRIQDYIICLEMGVAAVAHLRVFPAVPYKRGERCVRNMAVMSNYASLGAPPDEEEVRDGERRTESRLGGGGGKRLNFPQTLRDVVLGSGEIIADDMKFTVSHVVEPVERGVARITEAFHHISETVVKRRHEEWKDRRRKKARSKDDSCLIPLSSWSGEFSSVREGLNGGSSSDTNTGHHRKYVATLST